MKTLRPLSFLTETSSAIALIILNRRLDLSLITKLWGKSVLTAAADGASNELEKCFADQKDKFVPDLITGDFDSALPETIAYYQNKKVEIIATPDQDETDFTKCLRIVCQRLKSNQVSHIVALGGFGGRIDHSLANISTLYTAKTLSDVPLMLLSRSSVACLLDKGEHTLLCDTGLEGDWCGLIPVGQPADHVTTTGLKYNLTDQRMCFGELISTSNSLADTKVTVSTDQPLLWTMGYKTS
ncbi:thiamin pyrophosphokinase 1-like protein [Plakobranchus ocellatus]|uniref:Thiamine pyrophosphokinase n=1 Tax=Plakobranchus ocellatus TaxID=259542 RepID=A0AAV3Z6V4_9GAST|nr:thiamin pyrophosphokinase 1-like protein [Plakobranchus ocellatus]